MLALQVPVGTRMNSVDLASPTRRYPIPAGPWRVEEEIQRSRFITTVDYAPTADAARALVQRLREEFPDATHHCWAYVVGPPGSTGCIGLSDDGEPHGTAGKPMLTALLHSGLGDISAVVTRYFGGTLLGKGGLVKAYTSGVLLNLASLPRSEHRVKVELELVLDYTHIPLFQRMIPEFELEVLGETYGADVTYVLNIPEDNLESFSAAVVDRTHGQALVDVKGPAFSPGASGAVVNLRR